LIRNKKLTTYKRKEKENINIIITYQIVYIGVYFYIPHQIYRCISVWFIDFRASWSRSFHKGQTPI